MLAVSKDGSILLTIWYLVSLLDLLGFSGGNGSTFNNSILDNFLGKTLMLLICLFFFFILSFQHYNKGGFLINLYFYSATSFFLYNAQKIVLKI